MIPKLYLEDPPNGMSEIICLFLERKYMLGVISVKVQKPVSAHRSFWNLFLLHWMMTEEFWKKSTKFTNWTIPERGVFFFSICHLVLYF